MITEISIKGFKSLRNVERLQLGPLNILIGPNASGKSNFLDALKFLQGVGYGFTFDEILNGKPKNATGNSWDGIRGGTANVAHQIRGVSGDIDGGRYDLGGISGRIEFELAFTLRDGLRSEETSARYLLAIDSNAMKLVFERLTIGKESIFDTSVANNSPEVRPVIRARCSKGGKQGQPPLLDFTTHLPILVQARDRSDLPKAVKDRIEHVRSALGDLQSLDPRPSELRMYSFASNVDRLGDRGENFAALVEAISRDPASRSAMLGWLKELRPQEIDDIQVLPGAAGDRLFAVKEGSRVLPATVLSDGTLRFAAIVAAFLQPNMPATITIEEIENGVHASRMRLLVELLRSQVERSHIQAFVTTHSPIVLAWLRADEYKYVFWFKRNDDGSTEIVPIDRDPQVASILKKQPISELFAEGWLEGVL